jgi:hypothetical protein
LIIKTKECEFIYDDIWHEISVVHEHLVVCMLKYVWIKIIVVCL